MQKGGIMFGVYNFCYRCERVNSAHSVKDLEGKPIQTVFKLRPCGSCEMVLFCEECEVKGLNTHKATCLASKSILSKEILDKTIEVHFPHMLVDMHNTFIDPDLEHKYLPSKLLGTYVQPAPVLADAKAALEKVFFILYINVKGKNAISSDKGFELFEDKVVSIYGKGTVIPPPNFHYTERARRFFEIEKKTLEERPNDLVISVRLNTEDEEKRWPDYIAIYLFKICQREA
jgi:hypothetical protein